jgi:aryl-alcohol dehydrogenase-like predicted oxidoreductase
MAQPGISAAIASATTVEQLDELATSATLVLGADELKKLDDASAT